MALGALIMGCDMASKVMSTCKCLRTVIAHIWPITPCCVCFFVCLSKVQGELQAKHTEQRIGHAHLKVVMTAELLGATVIAAAVHTDSTSPSDSDLTLGSRRRRWAR